MKILDLQSRSALLPETMLQVGAACWIHFVIFDFASVRLQDIA